MPRMKQIFIDVEVNRIIEASRNSFAESENEILRRMLLDPAISNTQKAPTQKVVPRDSRRRGEWAAILEGNEVGAANMKSAYCTLLRMLAERDPQFLPSFSTLKSRTRRFVAQDPKLLYRTSPHLSKDHAMELTAGWFVDTNLSEPQVAHRVRAASELAHLKYGSQVKITKSERTIW